MRRTLILQKIQRIVSAGTPDLSGRMLNDTGSLPHECGVPPQRPVAPFHMAVPFNPETEVDRSAGLRPGTTSVFGFNIGALGSRGKAPAAVTPKRRYGAPRRRKGWRTP